MITFQDILLRLQGYWAGRGCAILQPYDMEVGAGTSHTATFLRALGPEGAHPHRSMVDGPHVAAWHRLDLDGLKQYLVDLGLMNRDDDLAMGQ